MIDRTRVLAASRDEVRQLLASRLSEVTPSRRDFTQFVATQKDALAVIACIAPNRSPDGIPWTTAQLVAHAQACDDAEVAALAVTTGAGGLSLADLMAIAAATTAPILRYDLLIDTRQVYGARLHGADAALFPAADLASDALAELVTVAGSLHMASIIEVLDEADLASALALPHALVGLDCRTAAGGLDVEGTRRLAEQVPRQRTIIALPEARSAAECAALSGLCDAVLVGEALLGADDVAARLARLTHG